MAYFLNGIFLMIFFIFPLQAKDFGIYGVTTSIEEEDLLLLIQKRAQAFLGKNQELWIKTMKKKIANFLRESMEAKNLKRARAYSLKDFDPSIEVKEDVFDHKRCLIVKKGTRFNPLSQVFLKEDLLFFDATDPEQLKWAKSFFPFAKWILVKGEAMKLEEELNRPVYFDQGGILTKRFEIEQVPTRIFQEGLKLKIESLPLEDKSCTSH